MFTRTVRGALKPGQGDAFAHLIEQKVLPILQKQKGFRDEFLLLSEDGKEAICMSIWESRDDAEAYDHSSYAEIKKLMEPFQAAPPKIDRYHVARSSQYRRRQGCPRTAPYGKRCIERASSPAGEGWVHYMFPEPGGVFPAWKSAFDTCRWIAHSSRMW